MRAYGFVEEIADVGVTVRLQYDAAHESVATLPTEMFGNDERIVMREGSFVEADVDQTLLVTRVCLMQVACWTQADIANKRAAELLSQLSQK